jgi:pyruvate/2-oxoglutarate/acetoin dehydrogenase E1 component
MTKKQIHNIYLHMTGKAEGLLEAGVEADFPVMFAEAIMEYNKSCKLTDEEILEIWRENERVYPMDRSRLLDRTRACIKKASEK